MRYPDGPIAFPAGHAGLPDYRVLATFRSEVAPCEARQGTMVNTPAVIAARFRADRVRCISPHPEASKDLPPMVARGIRRAAGR